MVGGGFDLDTLTIKPDIEEVTQHDDAGPRRVPGTEQKEFSLTEPISAVAQLKDTIYLLTRSRLLSFERIDVRTAENVFHNTFSIEIDPNYQCVQMLQMQGQLMCILGYGCGKIVSYSLQLDKASDWTVHEFY